jgi:signal transduction histidine kinase
LEGKPLEDGGKSSTAPPASGAVAIEDGDRLRVLDHVESGIAVVQGDAFLYINAPLLRMLGHASSESIAAERVSAIVGAPSYEAWTLNHTSGHPRAETWRRADGSVVTVDVSVTTMQVGDAAVRVALVRDVGASAATAQLQQTERLAAAGSLAASVAHQLNNPLAYVLANLNFVTEEVPAFVAEVARSMTAEQRARLAELTSAMSDARDGAERVARIVRDLRTFSRMDDEHRELVDVCSLLESACSVVERELETRARLVKQLDPVAAVQANPSRLAQAVLNLLVNAAHAIPAGAPSRNEVRVCTRSDSESGKVIIEVTDTGVGMSAAVQARIFEPFYTLKPPGEGTGLGLTTSLAIVASLGGAITVESVEGSGSTFRVTLPAAAGSAKRPIAAPPPEAEVKPRILIVDDELTLLSSLRRAIGRDADVSLAKSAAEAMAILEHDDRFDVVLCDIMMPDVTGIELFERVSSANPSLRERFVFMTGGAFSPTTQQFFEQTELPRLEKPFDVRELKRLLRRRAKTP